jgi:hypothetical protein
MPYLIYDGTKLYWMDGKKTVATFDATSGHGTDFSDDGKDYQKPEKQCVPWEGPIPEGTYRLDTWINSKVPDYSLIDGVCSLHRQTGVQVVPKEKKNKQAIEGGSCLELWGPNRVNLYPNDKETLNHCTPRRSGFYIHDSSKGASSGCIEVGAGFFKQLREWIKSNNPKNQKNQRILLYVNYKKATTTRGNTKT